MIPNGLKRFVLFNEFDEIVLAALHFDVFACFHGQYANPLVQFLSVSACLDAFHHDIFRRHERQFRTNMLGDDLFVDDEIFRDVHINIQNRVDGQERLCIDDTAVCGVVERTLEPLRRRRQSAVYRQRNDVSCESTDTLATHGVALVRHRGRADLILFKRLFDFLHVLQNTDIVGEFISALCDLREYAQNIIIHLTGIGLTGNTVHLVVSHFGDDTILQFLHLFFVAVEKLHEARLRARRALDPAEFDAIFGVDKVFVVHFQILQPKRGAFAHRRELRGLQMGEPERGQILILQRKTFQFVHDVDELFQHDIQSLVEHNGFCVAVDETARGAEVDNGHRLLRVRTVGFDVRHDVVTDFPFVLCRQLVINIVCVLFELIHLFLRDVEPKLHFRFGKRNPQLSPKLETFFIGEGVLHFFARVTGDQRIRINAVVCHEITSFA